MEKVKVIFRKEKNPYTNDYDVIAFIPELKANYGKIVCYAHIGQHSEADLEYYQNTIKANESEYKALLNELNGIYNDYELVVKQKINYKDLRNAWKN